MRTKQFARSSHMGSHICGLHYIFAGKRVYLPQVQLKSHTTINPICYTTQLTQTFHNPGDETLAQLQYTFPLYDGVTVNGYTVSYASKVLKGVVKQKEAARQTYQAAVDRGETAGLLESLPAGIFGVTLGNVPAKTDIVVEITYAGELKHDASIDGLRYTLPVTIAPRYGSYPGELLQSNTVEKGGIDITVDIDMGIASIRNISSPSNPISVSMGAKSTTKAADKVPFNPSHASATLAIKGVELDDDFVLKLLIDDLHKPQAFLEAHPTIPNQRAIITTLVPKFTLAPSHPEIVFIADQSGSMGGSKNTALVAALKVFLKSLPVGVRFNICAFGNSFKFLWPKSQAYTQANVDTAISFVNSFTASYGGTEILAPIRAAFEKRLTDLPLEVMLLTDGEVWQEHSVFEYINQQIHEKAVDARVFALGIGTDVSHTLVEGVARAGNGFAQFVTQNEETDQKVVRMLKGALYGHTKDYQLEVHYDDKDESKMTDVDDEEFEIVEKVNDCLSIADTLVEPAETASTKKSTSFFDNDANVDKPANADNKTVDRYAHLPAIDEPKLLQSPSTIPPLFPFNRTTGYVLLGPETTQKKVTSVTLRANSAGGPLELNIPVIYSTTPNIATIHQLAAKKAVQELEEGRGWLQNAKTTSGAAVKTKYESRFDEIVERECVRLGEKFQVAGKWTSFVAVENKTGEAKSALQKGQKKEKELVRDRHDGMFLADAEEEDADSDSDDMGFGVDHAVVQNQMLSSPPAYAAPSGFGAAPRKQLASMAARRYVDSPSPSPFAAASLFTGPSFGENRQTGALFGGSGSGSLFGRGPLQDKDTTPGLFGASQSGGSSLFGNSNANTGGGLSGDSERDRKQFTGFSFSRNNANATSSSQSGGGLFGSNTTAQSRAPSVFDSQNKPSPAAGVFGSTTQQTQAPPPSLFGGSRDFGEGPAPFFGPLPFASKPSIEMTPYASPPTTSLFQNTQNTNTHPPGSDLLTSPSSAPSAPPLSTQQSPPAGNGSYSFGSFLPSVLDRGEKLDTLSRKPGTYILPPPAAPASSRARSSIPLSSALGGEVSSNLSSTSSMFYSTGSSDRDRRVNNEVKMQDVDEDEGNVVVSKGVSNARMSKKKGLGGSGLFNALGSAFGRGGSSASARSSPTFADGVMQSKRATSSATSNAQVDDEAKATQTMHTLIALQTFSGAWGWSEELLSAIGLQASQVKKEEIVEGGDADVCATALAIAFLQTKVSGKKEVWEMVVEKAKAFLAAQGVDVEGVVTKAGGVFAS